MQINSYQRSDEVQVSTWTWSSDLRIVQKKCEDFVVAVAFIIIITSVHELLRKRNVLALNPTIYFMVENWFLKVKDANVL